MNPLLSLLSGYTKRPTGRKAKRTSWRRAPGARKAPRIQLCLERLEDRLVPSISISDATAIEGATAVKLLDRFVAAGSGGLTRPRSLVFGPDGNGDGAQDLYIVDRDLNAVLRYDGITGAFIDTFVASGSGGLNSPADLVFGPDGNLYVSSNVGNQVLNYNGSSGAFLGVVATGLAAPFGVTFGSDGSLYIANQNTDEVLRYTSSGLSVFVSAGSGGLNLPQKAVFGPDGNLYVASDFTGQVIRYNGLTGAFINAFTSPVSGQGDLLWTGFGTDGFLYTTAQTTSVCCDTSFNRFNSTTGAYVDTLSLGRDSWSFMVGPNNIIYYSGNGGANYIERYGHSSLAAFTVSLSAASATPVTVNYSTANGTALAGSDYEASSGTVTFAPGQTTRTILVRTLDDTAAEPNETFTVNLSNAVGTTIADGQGVATITDNDATVRTYTSANVPRTIPDPGTVNSTLTIADTYSVLDLNVRLSISHTYDEDLSVFLRSPTGTRVELFTGVGGSGNNFTNTVLDDEAATPIGAGAPPFTGTFRPVGSLSAFDGQSVTGVWTLEVTDRWRKQRGTLTSWALLITGPLTLGLRLPGSDSPSPKTAAPGKTASPPTALVARPAATDPSWGTVAGLLTGPADDAVLEPVLVPTGQANERAIGPFQPLALEPTGADTSAVRLSPAPAFQAVLDRLFAEVEGDLFPDWLGDE
jgi:subtilisin-like proprotein convertase family protein